MTAQHESDTEHTPLMIFWSRNLIVKYLLALANRGVRQEKAEGQLVWHAGCRRCLLPGLPLHCRPVLRSKL